MSKQAKQRGRFITVEGGEGVGKSTNLEVIEAFLNSRNIEFVRTREPGGTELAESIRALILAEHAEDMAAATELLLVFAARAQHLEKLIKPALAAGKWVLCDRFTDATYAYQGAGRELGVDLIEPLESLVQGSLRPDFTVILDLDPEIGMKRATARGELDRIEKEQMEFFQRVRACYLQIALNSPERCVVVDASRPLESVAEDLRSVLGARLEAYLSE